MEINILIVSLILSAFFSGIEIAFLSANKLRIALQRKKGTLAGKILSQFMKSPSHFLGTTLIGNNIALVLFSIMMTRLLELPMEKLLPMNGLPDQQKEFWLVLFQTLISTIVILIAGEFVPKALFRINPDRILVFFALPFLFVYYLLYPFVIGIVWLTNFFLKTIFKIDFKEIEPAFSKVDLEHFVKQITPKTEETGIDTNMFENALYLTQVKVRECMVPRNEIEAIEVHASIAELKKKFIETKLSRIIVYENSIDNILGYVHHFDLTKNPASIRSLLIVIPVVPATMHARDVLNVLTKDRKNIAWVVDEFGGTAGIVTLEDILEEIFGEIEDELDVEQHIEKQISDDEFIFSCRLEIDYLNDTYNLNIPKGEYETLGGYLIARHENIPKMNEKIKIDNFEFTILSVSDIRVETVKLRLLSQTVY